MNVSVVLLCIACICVSLVCMNLSRKVAYLQHRISLLEIHTKFPGGDEK